jgi:hypothetical protein
VSGCGHRGIPAAAAAGCAAAEPTPAPDVLHDEELRGTAEAARARLMGQLSYDFSAALTAPPTSNQVRFDAAYPYTAVQAVWCRPVTTDGIDVTNALLAILPGSTVYVQDKNDHTAYVLFVTTGPAVEHLTYVELPVTWTSNGPTVLGNNQAIEVVTQPPAAAAAPPTGTDPLTVTGPIVFAGPRSRLITPPAVEPLTLEEAKIWCGFDWPPGDPREPLLQTVIAASRAQVEEDTGFAFLTQAREVYVAASAGVVVVMPSKCHPVQRVVSMTWVDAAGLPQPIDPTWYSAVPGTGVVILGVGYPWPAALLTIQVIAGWPTVADLTADEPRLVHLVGRLVAHNMTLGRDHAISGTIVVEVPMGYADEVQPYRPETLA